MPAKKYYVRLTEQERQTLTQWSHGQRHSERERKRARILLLADEDREDGPCSDGQIAAQVHVDALTASRVRQRFAERGLLPSLQRKEQEKRKARVLDGVGEAHLLALTCSTPPEGRKEWSLHLLKDTLIEQRIVDSISHETVRQTLKKTNLSRG